MSSYSSTVTWDTIRSLTNPKVSKKIADNVTSKIPLLYFLDKQGNKELENGGDSYQLHILKELQTAQPYTGMTTFSDSEADPVTICEYHRKQLQQPIVVTGTKLLKNSGSNPEAIIDYATTLAESAEEGMKNTLAGSTYGIFSALTETDLGVTGLQNLVSSTPTTGTTGSLSRSTNMFWRNQTADITTNFQTSGLNAFRELFFECVRGDEAPDIGIITQAMYQNLHRSLTSTIHYNQPTPNTASGDLAFQHIYFQGVPIMFDSNVPANSGYFLNLKYLKLLVHADRDMAIRDFITPANGDYMIGRILWAGNLVASNLARQGVFTGSGDTF